LPRQLPPNAARPPGNQNGAIREFHRGLLVIGLAVPIIDGLLSF
jgi:hypothetical protein